MICQEILINKHKIAYACKDHLGFPAMGIQIIFLVLQFFQMPM